MRTRIGLGLALTLAPSIAFAAAAAPAPAKPLQIYVIDVEGGNSVLFVGPTGQSLLIDTGNGGPIAAPRDSGRTYDAIKDAGLTQIDHLILTHYHGDHFGGMEELSKKIPIKEFVDHGKNVQPGAGEDFANNVYPKIIASQNAKHTVAKVGDKISLGGGVTFEVVTSAGNVPAKALPGAGKPNKAECDKFQPADNNAEDPMSVGNFISYGKFHTAHFGDITRNIEFKLACPNMLLPTIDLFLGMHHGQDSSNSPALVHALRPRVAIMNNGTRKGGEPFTMMSIHTSPNFEDLWQMHFSLLSGQEYTTPGMFIADDIDEPSGVIPVAPFKAPAPGAGGQIQPAPVHNGKAYWIKVEAYPTGTFTVTNQRNGFSKTYTK